jgi:uncharacterized membrane protein YedE/YeeE
VTEVIVWSGWLGGLGVGLYALVQLALFGKPLGVSTGYGSVCSLASTQPFFKSGPYEQRNTWRLWFIIGLPLGGLVAALTSPGPIVASFSLGPLYDAVMPSVLWGRALVLLLGGIMMGLGARMANGCTSGHAIAGLALLNGPSVVAAAGFFAGGVVAVQLLFRL